MVPRKKAGADLVSFSGEKWRCGVCCSAPAGISFRIRLAGTPGRGGRHTLDAKMAKRDETRGLLPQFAPVPAHPASVDFECAGFAMNHHRGFCTAFRTICNTVPGSHGTSSVRLSFFRYHAGAESAYKCDTTVLSAGSCGFAREAVRGDAGHGQLVTFDQHR